MANSNPRTRTILGELERAEVEFATAQERHVAAQAEYEAARERFIGIRRLASEALSGAEWYRWEQKHEGVKFVGMEIGDAITNVLETHAYHSAFAHLENPKENRYSPQMHVDRLIEALEAGGCDFGGSTPRRVINAAVMNKKKSVMRVAQALYRVTTADAILESAKEIAERYPKQEESRAESEKEPKGESEKVDDDVPF
jgi:hypothetical protein